MQYKLRNRNTKRTKKQTDKYLNVNCKLASRIELIRCQFAIFSNHWMDALSSNNQNPHPLRCAIGRRLMLLSFHFLFSLWVLPMERAQNLIPNHHARRWNLHFQILFSFNIFHLVLAAVGSSSFFFSFFLSFWLWWWCWCWLVGSRCDQHLFVDARRETRGNDKRCHRQHK